jgi:hypothetical protein
MVDLSCPGNSSCQTHFHVEDPRYLGEEAQTHLEDDTEAGKSSTSASLGVDKHSQSAQHAPDSSDKKDLGFRRIIRNFTPSYVETALLTCDGSQS